MSISETVRATQTEESRQNQTYSQNFSANWQNRKVSILTAGVAIGATAIAVAATVLTGGIALIAFAVGGVAIAAGLGTSLFFAFKSPKPLEQSRMENITSQTASHAPTFEEMLARRREGGEDFQQELDKVPTFEEMLARRREEFMPKVESVEAEEAPDVEQPPIDKPPVFDDVLQTKEGSSYSYGKIALGTLGLAALVGAIYVANANGINLNPLSYFSSPGNVTPDPQPTPNPHQEDVTEPVSTNTSTPIHQANNGSFVLTPQTSQVRQPVTSVNGSFVPVSDRRPVVTPILSQCKAPTFNESWVSSSTEGYTPAPVTPFTSDQCGLIPPTGLNTSSTTPVPPAQIPSVTPVPAEEPEVTPLPDQSGLTSPANHSTSPLPEQVAAPTLTPVVVKPTETPTPTPTEKVVPSAQEQVKPSVTQTVNGSAVNTPTPSGTPTEKVAPPAQEQVKPFVTQTANDSTPTVTRQPIIPRQQPTLRFKADLPKAEQETSWVSKECMKFGQTLSKRFSDPYDKFFTGKGKDAWTSADHTGWKMMSSKDTCYYPPKATSIDAARARRMPMVEFCNCMMDLWKARNPGVTASIL